MQSNELEKWVKGWPLAKEKRLPSLPKINFGHDIPVLPRHAILASLVCFRIAREINTGLLNHLGEKGMVYMAAHHTLIADDRSAISANTRSIQVVINQALSGRYSVYLKDDQECVSVLREIQKWALCRKRYNKLYSDAM
jgi:hypothetical protein